MFILAISNISPCIAVFVISGKLISYQELLTEMEVINEKLNSGYGLYKAGEIYETNRDEIYLHVPMSVKDVYRAELNRLVKEENVKLIKRN